MVIPGLVSLAYLHCCDYLLFRVCFHSIYFAIIACEWQPAKPRTGQKILCDYLFGPFGSVSKMVSDLHCFHNLFTGIFHHDSGRDLTYRFFINFWVLFAQVFDRGHVCRNSVVLIAYIFEEIYLMPLILLNCALGDSVPDGSLQ